MPGQNLVQNSITLTKTVLMLKSSVKVKKVSKMLNGKCVIIGKNKQSANMKI